MDGETSSALYVDDLDGSNEDASAASGASSSGTLKGKELERDPEASDPVVATSSTTLSSRSDTPASTVPDSTTGPAQQNNTGPAQRNNAATQAPKCPAEQVLAFFKTVKDITRIMISDPEAPSQDIMGTIYGRHPTCQSKVAVALPGRGGEPRTLRGYWVDCSDLKVSWKLTQYKILGHNYVFPRATKADLMASRKRNLILVLSMPWGSTFHISGLFILDGTLALVSGSVMIQVWGKLATNERLLDHTKMAGQTDLNGLGLKRTRDRAQRGPPLPEPFNFQPVA
ncbi:hypothetical protein Sste5346_006435 [Sporothrix stenoceras]|uniref:Uncharacterized protein n=1 Tax=Sporothrix stenoceras TaxID=5173 RepID=A0ABR3YYY6_9PEZI